MPSPDFDALLSRAFAAPPVPGPDMAALAVPALAAVAALVEQGILASILLDASTPGDGARRAIEGLCADIDRAMTGQINLILHHPQFQQLEARWRGLHFLVCGADTGAMLKLKLLDIGKAELARTLRKFRGTAWDQSPIFRRIYEEEFGQLGGEPYGVLIGDYFFDHSPADIQLLGEMAEIAAAAHAPFITGAAPALLQMDSWAELANPRDLTRIFQTPEYVAWRALRGREDSRYLGLCLPRCLARLPYGTRTDPQEAFAFEEDVEGTHTDSYVWMNAAFAFGANVARAFALYGWCTRIRGIDGGGVVEGLQAYRFPTADGGVDLRGVTEIAVSEQREAELARNGLIPLVQRKNEAQAAFVSAHSVQQPQSYDDPAASANAVVSARLPYLFACCRFAHYLKRMAREKIGSSLSRQQLENWLEDWLLGYVDGSPTSSTDEWKAAHPLQEARVIVDPVDDMPGQYAARFFLRPHYQLEGITVAMRLVSRLPGG